MGLFDKKYCSICGKEIKLLGNRPLQDGNMCVECVRKLSPWFGGRKHTTVEAIKEQLAYREENQRKLASFNPSVVIGDYYRFYVDENKKEFVVSSNSKWRDYNPDIIKFSDVRDIEVIIDEDANEVFDTDSEGNDVSFNPPKYDYEYEFRVRLVVNNRFFDDIEVVLNNNKPENPGDELYMHYVDECQKLFSILMGRTFFDDRSAFKNKARGNEIAGTSSSNGEYWYCKKCGAKNDGNFCTKCGEKKPYAFEPFFCSKCGTKIESPAIAYCPKCGNKVN